MKTVEEKRIARIEKELSKPLPNFGGQSLRTLFTTDQVRIDSPQGMKYMRLVVELDMLTGHINY